MRTEIHVPKQRQHKKQERIFIKYHEQPCANTQQLERLNKLKKDLKRKKPHLSRAHHFKWREVRDSNPRPPT